MRELFEIPFSPWSEKARWALAVCGVPYVSRTYQPLLGELQLRRLLKRWNGPVTAPVLRDGAEVIDGSYAIARYADAHCGTGVRLFPPGEERRVDYFSELSDRGLEAGRALTLRRMLENREAQIDVTPKPLHRLPRVAARLGAYGIRRTLHKYGADEGDEASHEHVLISILDTLRMELASSPSRENPRTLLASLSYADLAMAQVVASLRFPSAGLRLGAAGRSSFEHPRLAELYPDLIGWRDALYARYRTEKAA
jgi:glutathione S-transferase